MQVTVAFPVEFISKIKRVAMIATRLIFVLYFLWMYERTNLLAGHNLLQVAHDVHVEHIDWEVVLAAHRCCCDVHNLETA